MLRGIMQKKDTNQLHLRMDRALIKRLDELSVRFKRETGNQVAVQIIKDCIEFWIDVEQAKIDTIKHEQDRFAKIKAEMLRHPMVEAAAAGQGTKPQSSKRKTRK